MSLAMHLFKCGREVRNVKHKKVGTKIQPVVIMIIVSFAIKKWGNLCHEIPINQNFLIRPKHGREEFYLIMGSEKNLDKPSSHNNLLIE